MSATAPSRDAVEAVASRFAAHDHGRDLDDLDPRGVAALARAEPAFQRDRADGGPTRTKSIQDDFSAKFYRRWRTIKGLVRETVVENDALRLRDGSRNSATDASDLSVNADDPDWWAAYVDDRRAGVVQASAADGFDFPTDDDGEAIDAFLDWLRGALDDELLEADRGPNGEPINRSNWTDVFIRRAYGRGLKFGNGRLREAGADVEGIDPSKAFNRPIHSKTLSRLYTRTFRELDGITEAVGQQVSRELTEGFAQGWNPRKIASAINDRVESVGYVRSKTLARTEVIKAHADSTLNRYKEEGVEGVDDVAGKAEFDTAGDNDVCSICRPLEGEVMSIAEASGLIPLHPNCRCAWLPVV